MAYSSCFYIFSDATAPQVDGRAIGKDPVPELVSYAVDLPPFDERWGPAYSSAWSNCGDCFMDPYKCEEKP